MYVISASSSIRIFAKRLRIHEITLILVEGSKKVFEIFKKCRETFPSSQTHFFMLQNSIFEVLHFSSFGRLPRDLAFLSRRCSVWVAVGGCGRPRGPRWASISCVAPQNHHRRCPIRPGTVGSRSRGLWCPHGRLS